jgi:hypothetical protein
MKISVILLALLLQLGSFQLSSNSLAYFATSEEACTPVDFRDSFPLTMRNQRGISWCFAHAASDYLQYTYQIPEQISAADVAINYYNAGVPNVVNFFKRMFSHDARIAPPQTGFIAIAVKRIQKEGYCPESIFPSETWTKVDTATSTQTEVTLVPAIEQMWALQAQVQNGQIANASLLPWFLQFHNVDQTIFFNLLKNSKKPKLLDALRITACQGSRKPFPNIPVQAHFDLKGPHFFEKMNASFNQRMPVTIDFFSSVFENYTHYRKTLDELHTVLIYGRKFDPATKECTYLMKDSHGSSCAAYAPEIKCEAGYLWFPESKMNEMMFSRLILERL